MEVKTKRKDEFLLLTNGISDMLAHMKKLVAGLKEVNGEISNAAEGMAAASEHFLQTSQNIQSEISTMKHGMVRMDARYEVYNQRNRRSGIYIVK